MPDKQISRFPVPELKELPADIRDRILAVQEKAGFVPDFGITNLNYLTKNDAVYARCRAKKEFFLPAGHPRSRHNAKGTQ